MAGRYRSPWFRAYRVLVRLSGRNLGVSAIIPDASMRKVLVLRGRLHGSWGFPGGAVQRGESIHDAIARECREELGADVAIEHLTGLYYSPPVDIHTCVFLCRMPDGRIRLSSEHSEFQYIELDALPADERVRATDALSYDGFARVRTLR